jgi:hypothetical protein
MELDEAGQLIWPVPTIVFADLLLSVVVTAHRTRRANTRSALLKMYVLTVRGHLAD